MSGPEERQRAVDLCLTTPMTTAQVVEHLDHPTRQCLERWPARDPGYAGHMAKPIIPLETRTKAIEPVPGGMRGSGPPNGSARASEQSATGSGRIARAAWPRCGPRTGTPARRQASDATGSGRRRRRGPAPQGRGAGTGERGDAGGGGGRRKRPGRRPTAPVEQGEDAAGRPSAPDVFARPDDMLARHRAGQPPTAATPGSGLTDTPGRVSGRPRRSPLPGAGTGIARSRPRSEPASRRRRPAGSWPRMVRRRMFPNDAGTAHTRARPRRLPAASPTAISRPRCRTGNGPRTSPGIRAGDGKGVPLAAGRLPRRPDRRMHGRFRSRRGRSPTGCSSGPRRRCRRGRIPGAFRPRMATAGGPDGWRSWTATAWHSRRAPRAVPRTTPPRRGFLGRMKTESVHPEHWEERTRSEALVPVDDCIRWHDHERIRRPLGWMSPVRYRQSQGMAA